jgi:hypothetical protein
MKPISAERDGFLEYQGFNLDVIRVICGNQQFKYFTNQVFYPRLYTKIYDNLRL